MHLRNSATIGRAETKAAKQAEREQAAAIVWAEVEAERQAVDRRTARLRAERLAREIQRGG